MCASSRTTEGCLQAANIRATHSIRAPSIRQRRLSWRLQPSDLQASLLNHEMPRRFKRRGSFGRNINYLAATRRVARGHRFRSWNSRSGKARIIGPSYTGGNRGSAVHDALQAAYTAAILSRDIPMMDALVGAASQLGSVGVKRLIDKAGKTNKRAAWGDSGV